MKPGDYHLEVAKDGMLTYHYCYDGDGLYWIPCYFHTLSEVGQGFKAAFRELIDGLNIEHGRELDHYPWTADFIVKEEKNKAYIRRTKIDVPKKLLGRCNSAHQMMTNPNDQNFNRYGGKGIEFRFESARKAAEWVFENLGYEPDKSLSRIDNQGHFEPGNLAWVETRKLDRNRASPMSKKVKALLDEYPDVGYADASIRNMLRAGLTHEQIANKWRRKK